MALQFYIGPSGSGKTWRLYRHIIEESIKNPGVNYMVVVPEQFTMRTQKELVMLHPNRGILNIDVLSFNRLAYRIFEETGAGERMVLDDIAKSLILRKLAAEHEEELEVLGKNLRKLGYIDEVKSVITEFLQYGVGEEELSKLMDAAGGKGILRCKLKDIGLLYRSFREALAEKYITAEELLETAGVLAEQSGRLKGSVVAFDGFTGFTPIQNRFLARLSRLCGEIYVTVTVGDGENPYIREGEQKLFYLGQKTVTSLERLLSEEGILREKKKDVVLAGKPVYRYRDRPALSFLEENLFRYRGEVFEGEQGEIRLFSAPHPLAETGRVCMEILKLVREEGFRYREIALVSGDMENYAPYAQRMFDRYGIPCFIDQNRGVLLNPLIEYIRSGLRIILEDFSYESVFHFVRAGFWQMERELTDLAENYVLSRGIRGAGRWNKRFPFPKRGFDGVKMERIETFREALAEALRPLCEGVPRRKKRSVAEMTAALYDFISRGRIQTLLADYEKSFAESGLREKEKEFHQIYKMVIDLLDKLVELLGEEQVTASEYAQLLDAGFAEMEVGLIPSGIDQVLVGDIERTRLLNVRVLFFVGVNDGIVPRTGSRGGLLSQHDRELLKGREVELAPTAREQAFIQRFYLYMNMTKPEDRLYLSFSRTSASGESLNPSYLIEEAVRLFPGIRVREYGDCPRLDEIEALPDGLNYLASGFQETRTLTPGEKELLGWYARSEEYGGLIASLARSSFSGHKTDRISRIAAGALYGRVLENSITRLEKYAACAYAHFLRYGLVLRERELYTLEARDIGMIYHECLQIFSEEMRRRGLKFSGLTREQAGELSDLAVSRCVAEYGGEILGSSARNEYMALRIRRILMRSVLTLGVQAGRGDFEPGGYEVAFPGKEELSSSRIPLPGGGEIRMQGRIDRVDVLEDQEKLYLKIIDYKSGDRDLDLNQICEGLELQLMVYMNAAMELWQRENPGREIIPAGILYYHIDDPLVDRQEGEDGDAAEKRLLSKLRMRGMVNADRDVLLKMDRDLEGRSDVIPVRINRDGSLARESSVFTREEFQQLSSYVNLKIADMGQEILDGSIGADPAESAGASPCAYCEFQGVCGMGQALAGRKKRILKKRTREELWDEIHRRTAEGH